MTYKNVVHSTTHIHRAIITVAGIEVEGFQLPIGEYVMSQSQPAKAIAVDEILVRHFLASESLKSLPGKDYRFDKIPIESNGNGKRGSSRISPITIDIKNPITNR